MTTANPLDPGQSRSFTWHQTKRAGATKAATAHGRCRGKARQRNYARHPSIPASATDVRKNRTTRRLASTFHLLRGAGGCLASGARTRVQGGFAAATCVVMAASGADRSRRSSIFIRDGPFLRSNVARILFVGRIRYHQLCLSLPLS
jgi:hypothetical protein